jgi:hypothetical protein
MTTAQPPRSDNLAQRWLRTGGEHARAGAPSHQRSPTVIAAFYDNLDQQAELLLSAGRVSNRLEGLRTPTLAPSASAKSP